MINYLSCVSVCACLYIYSTHILSEGFAPREWRVVLVRILFWFQAMVSRLATPPPAPTLPLLHTHNPIPLPLLSYDIVVFMPQEEVFYKKREGGGGGEGCWKQAA